MGNNSKPKEQIEAFTKYKKAKEIEIKRLSDEYKPQLTPECYNAMYNYQVEITD
jgi:hypothetical protein